MGGEGKWMGRGRRRVNVMVGQGEGKWDGGG